MPSRNGAKDATRTDHAARTQTVTFGASCRFVGDIERKSAECRRVFIFSMELAPRGGVLRGLEEKPRPG